MISKPFGAGRPPSPDSLSDHTRMRSTMISPRSSTITSHVYCTAGPASAPRPIMFAHRYVGGGNPSRQPPSSMVSLAIAAEWIRTCCWTNAPSISSSLAQDRRARRSPTVSSGRFRVLLLEAGRGIRCRKYRWLPRASSIAPAWVAAPLNPGQYGRASNPRPTRAHAQWLSALNGMVWVRGQRRDYVIGHSSATVAGLRTCCRSSGHGSYAGGANGSGREGL